MCDKISSLILPGLAWQIAPSNDVKYCPSLSDDARGISYLCFYAISYFRQIITHDIKGQRMISLPEVEIKHMVPHERQNIKPNPHRSSMANCSMKRLKYCSFLSNDARKNSSFKLDATSY